SRQLLAAIGHGHVERARAVGEQERLHPYRTVRADETVGGHLLQSLLIAIEPGLAGHPLAQQVHLSRRHDGIIELGGSTHALIILAVVRRGKRVIRAVKMKSPGPPPAQHSRPWPAQAPCPVTRATAHRAVVSIAWPPSPAELGA